MKNNWQTKKLHEICDFYSGLWTGKKPPYVEVGVIRNTNFTKEGKLDDSDIALIKVEKKQLEKRKLKYGDIILEKSGGGPKQPVGRVVLFNKKTGDFSFSNFTSVIRVKNSDQIDFNYLHRYLFSFYISGITETMQSHSTGIRNLDLNKYKETEVSFPTLTEQKRIVKTLDEVFEKTTKAQENTERNLKNSNDFFESYLNNIFTNSEKKWEEKKISDVFEIKPPKKEAKQKLNDDDLVSFVPMEDLAIGYKYFAAEKERRLKDVQGSYTYFANDDVLLAKITPCFENGKLGIARNLKNGVGFGSSEYIVFRTKGTIIPDYLFYFLSREQFKKEGEKRMAGASGHKRVSKSFIENYKIPYPGAITEQKTIVGRFDELAKELQKLNGNYEQKLSALGEFKKSILRMAFTNAL